MTPSPERGAAGLADTQVRRLPENALNDPAALAAIVRSAILAHVGVVIDGLPYVLPVACAPWEPQPGRASDTQTVPGLLMHGSTGSRLFRTLAAGSPVCATITHLDGLVLARSAYNSSMTYRSVMIMGVCEVLAGDEKVAALATLTDHLLPGRRASLRETTRKEDAATLVVGLRAESWSVKVGDGGPDDPPEDIAARPSLWAGVVPISNSFDTPIADEHSTDHELPEYLSTWHPPGHAQR